MRIFYFFGKIFADIKYFLIESLREKYFNKNCIGKSFKRIKSVSKIKELPLLFNILIILLFINPITPLDTSENYNYLPEKYDLRDHYNCNSFKVIRNQGRCGGCWAFATAEVISDLICIKSGGKIQTIMSETYLLTNCIFCFNNSNIKKGCNGGHEMYAFIFWILKGLPSGGLYGDKKSCLPFPFSPYEVVNETTIGHRLDFREACDNSGVSLELIQGSDFRVLPNDTETIMKEIYDNGPVTASFIVYEDFDSFFNSRSPNIYKYDRKSEKRGPHAIKIIGWGNEIINGTGEPYWICVNSWGENEGLNGTFKIRRGTNECDIESFVISAYINSDKLNSFYSEQSVIVFENHFFSFKNFDKDFR